MYRNKLKTLAFGLIATTIFASSCKKEVPQTNDQEQRQTTITITSPSENQEIEENATVNITGKIESSESLHGYEIIIRKKADSTVHFYKEEHAHGTVINYTESWVNNLHGHNEMELEVKAILDHDGTSTSKKVNFHCHGH